MALTDYAGLVAEIIAKTKRDDQADSVPGYIALMEAEASRFLRVRQMLSRTTLTVNAEYVALPADFAGVRSISLPNGAQPLVEEGADELENRYMGDTGAGEPTRFAVEGGNFRFHPTPAGSYAARLSYYQKIPALTEANPTNWLFAAYPDVYLYGALMQFGLDAHEDAEAAKWGALFQKALQDIKRADARERMTGGTLRSDVPMQGSASINDFIHGRA